MSEIGLRKFQGARRPGSEKAVNRWPAAWLDVPDICLSLRRVYGVSVHFTVKITYFKFQVADECDATEVVTMFL